MKTPGGDEHADTFAEWLRGLSAAEQDQVLGPKRARDFRAGDLTPRRFTERTDPITLAELVDLAARGVS